MTKVDDNNINKTPFPIEISTELEFSVCWNRLSENVNQK